jgi:hypothetical protein
VHFSVDPNLKPTELQPPTAEQRMALEASMLVLILLLGAYMASLWQAVAH